MSLSAADETSSATSENAKTLVSNVSIEKSTTSSTSSNTNHVHIRFTIALAVPAGK